MGLSTKMEFVAHGSKVQASRQGKYGLEVTMYKILGKFSLDFLENNA